jgi:SAM-dependent methyltransferase
MPREHYDSAYFDKWYRSRTHRVRTTAQVDRLVRFVVGAAEYVLDRPVRSVLDVGAGEGHWYPLLQKIRPRVRYVGVEPSEYAVTRFGRARHLRRGGVADLASLSLHRDAPKGFDLVVCCGVLNYVGERDLTAGLQQMAALTAGVAFLELFTSADSIVGDTSTMNRRPAAWYRTRLRRAGLRAAGLHLYVPTHNTLLSELELAR